MFLSIVWRQGFPLFARQWLGITDAQPAHRARNSNIFGSDKCYKHCLCGGGCCNDCLTAWTYLWGEGWGSLWQEEGGQWASEKLRVIVSIKRLWMFIKTFRTLVNHYNCSFELNSNSPKLNTTYTSHLICFGPMLVSIALFTSLSLDQLQYGYPTKSVEWQTNLSAMFIALICWGVLKLSALPYYCRIRCKILTALVARNYAKNFHRSDTMCVSSLAHNSTHKEIY